MTTVSLRVERTAERTDATTSTRGRSLVFVTTEAAPTPSARRPWGALPLMFAMAATPVGIETCPPSARNLPVSRPAGRRTHDLSGLAAAAEAAGMPPPEPIALENALRALAAFDDVELRVDRVVPSAEGGVGIYAFGRGDRFVLIECLNDGSIVSVAQETVDTPAKIAELTTDKHLRDALREAKPIVA